MSNRQGGDGPRGPSPLAAAGARALAISWALVLAFAVLAQAATTWRVLDSHLNVLPAFGSLGLTTARTETGWVVLPAVEIPGTTVPVGRVLAVDGRAVGDRSASAIAAWLRGPDGRTVTLVIGDPDVGRTVVLTRTEANRAALRAEADPTFLIVTQAINVLTALALIAAASLIRLRRAESGVAWAFSFAFLVLATVGCGPLWAALRLPEINNAIDAVWISLFLMAIPALPTGVYAPPWTRWIVILGPVLSVALIRTDLDPRITEVIRFVLLSAALGSVALRFTFTPAGAERQQLKWASLGLSVGLVLFAAGIVLSFSGTGLVMAMSIGLAETLRTAGYALHRMSVLVMAAGVVVCLMDYRLNDADAAVGRSAGYALLTTLIAVIWAVGGAWINRAIGFVTGNGDPTLSTALSTVIALGLLAPAQSRILTWTEARFQRALVRLRSLPDRLSAWRHGDDPQSVARSALASIVDGVNADQAALVLINDTGRVEVLASHNATGAEVIDEIERAAAADALSLFQLRLALTTEADCRGFLLLGRRSDGASYSRDERAAIAAVLAPLSVAIGVTAMRARHKAALLSAIASMETRLAGMESRAV